MDCVVFAMKAPNVVVVYFVLYNKYLTVGKKYFLMDKIIIQFKTMVI